MDDDPKLQEQADDKLINDAFEHLLNDYLASRHRKKTDLITKAFTFARQAHKGVRRLSGEPYIMHPIAVAQICCSEIGLGSTSICSALLHDVVEDTDYTVEDITNIFGPKIAQIVDGLTKISGGIFGEQASAQAENFKKLLLTMSEDIRVILIKICDRLHNMRTLQSQPANKQYKIAGETLYIYAPLANFDIDTIEIRKSSLDSTLRSEFENANFYNINVMSNLVSTHHFGTSNFFTPLTGIITQPYAPSNHHYGIDIATKENQVVKAALEGTVIFSSWTPDYGYTIGIQHENNYFSTYKHNATLLKKEGEFVKAGEAIAVVGESGSLTTGPHLHFELWRNGTSVNPQEYINFEQGEE
mgnify:CR=1 FL=1